MNQTIKNSIIRYLEENPDWQYGGAISRAVAEIHLCKESNVERRQRELEDEGKIESQYVTNPNGRGNKVVQYKLRGDVLSGTPSYRPEVLRERLISQSQKSLI